MSENPKFSVVVPVYKSSASLFALHQKLVTAISSLSNSYEIIYVEDSSPDDSWQTLVKLHSENKNVRIIRLSRNFGQFQALLCGIEKSKGEIIITIDDDLQYDPNDILKLQAYMAQNNYLLVYGIPEKVLKGKTWYYRNLLLNFMLGKSYTSSFRIFRRKIILSNGKLKTDLHFEAYEKLYIDNKHKGYITVPFYPRHTGRSSYGLLKRFGLITRYYFDYFPALLNPFYFIAAALIVTGIALCTLISIGLTDAVTLYYAMGIMHFIFAGIICLGIAIIGSYLVKVISQNRKVKYVVIEER